ncbi:MBL fold metallo-hydrolase [Apilactobacillus apinorum]|uniref:MBL fold metallo-hydrolase n=1 Tax=Apilactobacillus apinorum TaxID=1218495 RepID=A0ABP9ZFY2_9LACO
MKITVLGYYGGYPANGIGTSGYLIQNDDFNLLLDCGSGVLLELEKYINPYDIDAVLLSHYHSDHIADVGVLQHYWQLAPNKPDERVLPIYGHQEDMDNYNKLSWFDVTVGKPYDENQVLSMGGLEISFKKTQHPVVTYAVKIKDVKSNETIVYTGDTKYFGELSEFCAGADLLITDTNFYADKEGTKWHMTSKETGELANNANVKSVLISHLPQYGNLNDLLEETQKECGNNINVKLPSVGLVIDLKDVKSLN